MEFDETFGKSQTKNARKVTLTNINNVLQRSKS